MSGEKKKTIAGTGVEVYLDGAYGRQKPSGEVFVNVIPRKRRDVNPDAPYAGAYVRSKEYKTSDGKSRTTTNQAVSLEAFNQMREVNDLEPLTKEDVVHSMGTYNADGSQRDKATSLVERDAPVVFKTNVFSENEKGSTGKWSHVINVKEIHKTDVPGFSFEKEAELQKAKKAERAATADKPAEKPKEKEAAEPAI